MDKVVPQSGKREILRHISPLKKNPAPMPNFHLAELEPASVHRMEIIQQNTSGLPVRASSCDYFCATSPVSVDGTDFLPEFSFLAGHLLRLILRPCIEYPASMADQCERQQFRFVVCARWLFVRLGRPTEQPKGENRYIFPLGHISAVADISPRSEHNAGYIVLNYNQTV